MEVRLPFLRLSSQVELFKIASIIYGSYISLLALIAFVFVLFGTAGKDACEKFELFSIVGGVGYIFAWLYLVIGVFTYLVYLFYTDKGFRYIVGNGLMVSVLLVSMYIVGFASAIFTLFLGMGICR